MSDIPEDIKRVARDLGEAWFGVGHHDSYLLAAQVEAALSSERERWQKQDDAATTVYGRLLWHHMSAARKDFNGSERAKLYELIEAFSALFPSECAVWDARCSPERAGE